jgi:hypothetical protein
LGTKGIFLPDPWSPGSFDCTVLETLTILSSKTSRKIKSIFYSPTYTAVWSSTASPDKFSPLAGFKGGFLFSKNNKKSGLISKKSLLIYFKSEKCETSTIFFKNVIYMLLLYLELLTTYVFICSYCFIAHSRLHYLFEINQIK